MVARNVSRAWRDTFSSPDFSVGTLKMHFRTQWERADLGDANAKKQLISWLEKASLKRLRKQSGQYLSMSVYHYHYRRGETLVRNQRSIEHQYNSGRIALRMNEGIVVHSLKNGPLAEPKVYLETNRVPIRPLSWILADDFVVAYGNNR